jgi:hypothetical protein
MPILINGSVLIDKTTPLVRLLPEVFKGDLNSVASRRFHQVNIDIVPAAWVMELATSRGQSLIVELFDSRQVRTVSTESQLPNLWADAPWRLSSRKYASSDGPL